MGNMQQVYNAVHQDNPIVENFSDERNGVWYVVHTEPQRERIVQTNLCADHIGAYLPLAKATTRLRGTRSRVVHFPMIRGYVFVRFRPGEERWGCVRATVGVIDFLYGATPTDQRRPAIISADMMRRVASKEHELLTAKTCKDFQVGQEVEAVDGPWVYFKGQIEELFKEDRIKVGIEANGRVIPVEFPASMLKAV